MLERRELSGRDAAALKSQFDDYETRYKNIASVKIKAGRSLIDGSEGNISDARYIAYEGLDDYFGHEFLNSVIPRLVLNCLATTENCDWFMFKQGSEWEYGVDNSLLERPVIESALRQGEWLEVSDFDETPNPRELALESYDDIKAVLARKRVFQGSSKRTGEQGPDKGSA